jgi:tetratricopeptide (TPR) repeat protein
LLRRDSPLKAAEYCRRASEAEPSNVTHVVGYAAALVQAKRFDTAVGVLRKVIAIAPDNSTAHANLATALFELKRYVEAREQYEWLAVKQPNLAAAYYFLAICYDRLGKNLDAMANYQQYLRLADPEKNKLDIDKVNLRLSQMQKKK